MFFPSALAGVTLPAVCIRCQDVDLFQTRGNLSFRMIFLVSRWGFIPSFRPTDAEYATA